MKQHHDPENFVECYTQIHEQLKQGKWNVCDQLSQICQTVMWGDKNNDTFFDYFCDQNTIQLYVTLVQTQNREIVIQVIKSLTMLLQNIQKSTSINYILSHPGMNKLIIEEYNFNDDEIIAYYINLLKGVSIRIDSNNVQLFFNQKFSTFPMVMRAISFYNHKENLIRTSVRNIVLGVTMIKDPKVRIYINNFPFILFHIQFASYMKDTLFYINQMVEDARPEHQKIIKLLLDDQLDILYFLEDFMKNNQDSLNIIINAIFAYGFIPSIIMSLIQGQGLSIKFILFLLIQIYKTFTLSPFLDTLTLMILSRSLGVVDFIQTQNRFSQLNKYSKTQSMSSVWEQQTTFMAAYSQIVYEEKNEELLNLRDLIQGKDAIFLYEDLRNITEVLGLQSIKSTESNYDICKCPINIQNHLEGKQPNLASIDQEGLFYNLMKNLRDQDDTVVFMMLLFIKTLRHSKHISHTVLHQIGLLTPDKNLALYQSQECVVVREFLLDNLLEIIDLGVPPYRLGTFIMATQLLLDLSRQDLENYQLGEQRLKKFKEILLAQLQKIDSYMINHIDTQYVIDFFLNEFKVITKNSIQIWPQPHINILFPLTQAGICQIDPKHNDSIYFIEYTQPQEIVRRDLMVLMILKFVAEQLIREVDFSIQMRPQDYVQWVQQQIYSLNDPQYARWRYQCMAKINDQEFENCYLLEDDYALVIAQEVEPNKVKILLSANIKNTDEIIQKLNLRILHVTYQIKVLISIYKNQTHLFDLEFSTKLVCSDVKKMIDKKKMNLKKIEVKQISNFLRKLEEVAQ